jgi:hypothetical protein
LINAYFINWAIIEDRQRLQQLIVNALQLYERRNPIVLHFKRNANVLLTEKAAEFISESTLPNKQSVLNALKSHFISVHSTFAGAALAASIRRFTNMFPARDGKSRDSVWIEHLQYALDHLLIPETPGPHFYALIEFLILSSAAETSTDFQKRLREYVLKHDKLGDPRLPRNSANWTMVSRKAADRFLSWLARESILFFFNYVLPDNDRNRHRKDFWLRYHAQIRDFQVALSDDDYRRLSAVSRRSEVPEFSRVNHPTTSAFLMRFGDERSGYYVVEFSETGNAAYIFAGRDFLLHIKSLRRPTFQLSSELKHSSKVDKIIHNVAWQYKAEQQLARLGIRP